MIGNCFLVSQVLKNAKNMKYALPLPEVGLLNYFYKKFIFADFGKIFRVRATVK
jgi:hypothetical protein